MSTASIVKALNHQHAAVRFRAPACSAVRILRVYLRPCVCVSTQATKMGAYLGAHPSCLIMEWPVQSRCPRSGAESETTPAAILIIGRGPPTLATQHVRRRHARAIHEDDHAFWARRLVAAVSMVARAGRVFGFSTSARIDHRRALAPSCAARFTNAHQKGRSHAQRTYIYICEIDARVWDEPLPLLKRNRSACAARIHLRT